MARFYLCISCDKYKCVTIDEVFCLDCQTKIRMEPAEFSLRARADREQKPFKDVDDARDKD